MNDKSAIYHIKLTPTGKYFFGGEITFGADGGSNYLVKSNRYPQQTGILGMLRQQLLMQNGLLKNPHAGGQISDLQAAEKLIGSRGFDTENCKDYGVIKQLSPIFMEDDESNQYLTAPLDEGWRLRLEPGSPMLENESTEPPVFPLLENVDEDEGKYKPYSYKKGTKHQLMATTNGNLKYTYHENCIFIPSEQIGIKKNDDGATEQNAFYKQTSYLLKKGFAFAFFVHLNGSEMPFKLNDALLEMGGERSGFKMEVEKISDVSDFAQVLPEFEPDILTGEISEEAKGRIDAKILLTANAYANARELLRCCHFAITQTVPFRYVKTNIARTRHYYNLRDWDVDERGAPQRSQKYNLLQKGSVLYVKKSKLAQVEEALNAYKQFQKIGYNHYQVL